MTRIWEKEDMQSARIAERNGTLQGNRTQGADISAPTAQEREGGRSMGKRTAEWMREEAKFKLKIGKKVKIEKRATTQNGDRVLRSRRTGTILALYPYIFTVLIGDRIESFRYNELFGNEEMKVRI